MQSHKPLNLNLTTKLILYVQLFIFFIKRDISPPNQMYVLQFWPVMLFNYLFLVCLTQFFFKVKQPNDTYLAMLKVSAAIMSFQKS